MENKNIIIQKQAVAGVVEAILIVTLIAIILSMVQLIYIPQIMEQREAEHMDQVATQFSQLKFSIDVQSAMGQLESDIPISSPITLGSNELPYFITARATGELKVIPKQCSVNVSLDTTPSEEYNYCLGLIKYNAYNAYFVSQSYILESGGIIISQPNGNSIVENPPIAAELDGKNITIDFTMVNVTPVYGKDKSPTTHDTIFIRTNFSNITSILNNVTVNYINISSKYLSAWNISFHDVLQDIIRVGGINIKLFPDQHVEITPNKSNGYSIILNLNIVKIYAQISPGWIR